MDRRTILSFYSSSNRRYQMGQQSSQPACMPRHLLRVWLRDSEFSGDLPADIKNKFDAMHAQPPDFYLLDELEEDEETDGRVYCCL
jgi:hypothetical protein